MTNSKAFTDYLLTLWQGVDEILTNLHQADLSPAELAHLTCLPHLEPEAHYQQQTLPFDLAKAMVKAVISYRSQHLAYYVVPNATFLQEELDLQTSHQQRHFWLGWGI